MARSRHVWSWLSAVLVLTGSGVVRAAADPAPLDRVLSAHVHGRDGLVSYGALHADADRRADLDAFLADASDERTPDLATLLNAYNAVVLSEVLRRWPIASVRDVPDFFTAARHRVGCRDVSLDALEKEWMLPRFRDPRVHFALVCGARGCPPLQRRAFRATDLEATLERITRDALASRRFLRAARGRIVATPILDWYRADFERAAGSTRAFVARYRRDLPADLPFEFEAYDWRLNAAP